MDAERIRDIRDHFEKCRVTAEIFQDPANEWTLSEIVEICDMALRLLGETP
jgi:transcriptional regulator GlxA family with amidase domain